MTYMKLTATTIAKPMRSSGSASTDFHYLELNYDGPGTVSNDIFNHVVAALYDAGTPADVELYMNVFTIKGFPSPWGVMNIILAVIQGDIPKYRSHWREALKWKRA